MTRPTRSLKPTFVDDDVGRDTSVRSGYHGCVPYGLRRGRREQGAVERLVGSPAAFRPGESRPDNHLTDGEPGEYLITFSARNTTRSAVCVPLFPTFLSATCRCTSYLHVHPINRSKHLPFRLTGLYSSPLLRPNPPHRIDQQRTSPAPLLPSSPNPARDQRAQHVTTTHSPTSHSSQRQRTSCSTPTTLRGQRATHLTTTRPFLQTTRSGPRTSPSPTPAFPQPPASGQRVMHPTTIRSCLFPQPLAVVSGLYRLRGGR